MLDNYSVILKQSTYFIVLPARGLGQVNYNLKEYLLYFHLNSIPDLFLTFRAYNL
jgi:hypothetical protein